MNIFAPGIEDNTCCTCQFCDKKIAELKNDTMTPSAEECYKEEMFRFQILVGFVHKNVLWIMKPNLTFGLQEQKKERLIIFSNPKSGQRRYLITY